tara:strand:- start:162 stop:557 length:396 start_codon:yes stop_codon:yes gene_type:complete
MAFDSEGFVLKIQGSSKAELMKKYGPKIKAEFGKGEYNFVKDDATGPGGVDRLRKHITDLFMSKGGMAKKKMNRGGMMAGKAKAAKKMMRGGVAKKKMMRGGGMAKMAQKKMMRGGMAKKKMMRGGAVKKK